eukprot:TRINITY_DN13223_c1_g1_i2.p1 TRINITY_DN13223_c1_g1~~TRINITY_DN13223_c1_g1_i2.p1  ORF type:complete len:434 (+),score=50.88 TRINITY_DN13223_c1_g1_i2:63-1364(+)
MALANCSEIDKQLRKTLELNKIGHLTSMRADICLRELNHVLQGIWPCLRLRAHGSFAAGLCLKNSALDASCYSAYSSSCGSPPQLAEVLFVLRKQGAVDVIEDLSWAQVPTVKLRFAGTLNVNLHFNYTEPFLYAQLLRAYSDLSPLVRESLLLVSTWAECMGIVGEDGGLLSSRALAFMMIYYMQVDPHIQLPCLPIEDFDGSDAVPPSGRPLWSSDTSLASVLDGFFWFYAREFDWQVEVVTPTLAARTTTYDRVHQQLENALEPRLQIADPFFPSRNLTSTLSYESERWLYDALQGACAAFAAGGIPEGLHVSSFQGSGSHLCNPTEKSLCQQRMSERCRSYRSVRKPDQVVAFSDWSSIQKLGMNQKSAHEACMVIPAALLPLSLIDAVACGVDDAYRLETETRYSDATICSPEPSRLPITRLTMAQVA